MTPPRVTDADRVGRDLWRMTARQLWLNPRSGWSNVRFLVGMKIGGFKSATREKS